MYSITVPFFARTDKEKMLRQLERCGVKRVALVSNHAPGVVISSESDFLELQEAVAFFRERGYEIIIWVGETVGHGRSKVTERKKYMPLRFFEKGDTAAYCPTDPLFREDLCAWVTRLATFSPDMIMLDDDLRLDGGCCCETHMKMICDILGETISEQELYQKAFAGGKNQYRDAWLKAQGDSMREIAKMLRDAVNAVDPHVRLGLCCGPSVWDDDGTDPIEVVKLLAGDTKPFLRLIGAPYWTTCSFNMPLGEVIEHERMGLSWCRNQGIEVISEGDTYPRPRVTCPASHLECFDTALRADGTADGILKYMFDYVSDAEYELGYANRMVENLSLYDEIHAAFDGKTAVGVHPYSVMHTIETADLSEKPDVRFFGEPQLGFAVKNSLPTCYEGDGVSVVFGEAARHIPTEQLKNGSIIDIAAARILEARGVDVGLVSEKTFADLKRENPDLPAISRVRYLAEDRILKLNGDAGNVIPSVSEGAEILTVWESTAQQFNGIYRYENAEGMRFIVLPLEAEKARKLKESFDSYPLRRLLLDQMEWLGRKPLDAYTLGDHPFLYSLVKKNDRETAIGLWNLFDDKINHAEVKVNFDYKNARFINCQGHAEAGKIVLDSTLYPYEFAAIVLE